MIIHRNFMQRPLKGIVLDYSRRNMELKNKEQYPEFCLEILDRLYDELSGDLYYHRPEHTIDVSNVCEDYIERYALSVEDARLLRIAAIAHDFGYTQTYRNHEEEGIKLVTPILKKNNFNEDQINQIAGMIMATKVPQVPTNFLEQILADADLDYLGRDDYNPLSERLYKEFKIKGIAKNRKDWLRIQISFLYSHNFHTDFAEKNRENVKAKILANLQKKVKSKKITNQVRKFLRRNMSDRK